MNENKKKLLFFIFGGILLVVIIILLYVIFADNLIPSKSNKTKSKTVSGETKKLNRLEQKAEDKSSKWPTYNETASENYEDNLSVKTAIQDSKNNLIILIKNINKEPITLITYVDYKDADGNILSTEKSYDYNLMPSTDNIITVSTVKDYDSYDIRFEASKAYSQKYETVLKDIKLTPSDDGKNIGVNIKNNSDENKYSVVLCVTYFYDDELQGASCTYGNSLDPKASEDIKFDNYYFSKKYKGFNFNNIRVFINEV